MTNRMTRRQALEWLGTGAAAVMAAGRVLAQPAAASLTFPKGAVIRTILRDYAPEELAGGATLFHEHMQLAADFGAKFARQLPRPAPRTDCLRLLRAAAAPAVRALRPVRTSCTTST